MLPCFHKPKQTTMNITVTREYPWGGVTNFQAKVLAFFNVSPYNESFRPKKHTMYDGVNQRWEEDKWIHFISNLKKINYVCWFKAKCTGTQNIQIHWSENNIKYGLPNIFIDGRRLKEGDIADLILNEGFGSLGDFLSFYNKDFDGKLIHWSDVRY